MNPFKRKKTAAGGSRKDWCPFCERVVTWTQDPLNEPAPGVFIEDHWVCDNFHEAHEYEIEAWAESRPKYASRKIAHDSGDGETIYHCPFCGGGQVTGRSDGSVECGYCQANFTVQVQPTHPGVPQTIDGQPYQNPEMPGEVGQVGAEEAAAGPEAPGGTTVDPVTGEAWVGPEGESGGGVDPVTGQPWAATEEESANPFAKKSAQHPLPLSLWSKPCGRGDFNEFAAEYCNHNGSEHWGDEAFGGSTACNKCECPGFIDPDTGDEVS